LVAQDAPAYTVLFGGEESEPDVQEQPKELRAEHGRGRRDSAMSDELKVGGRVRVTERTRLPGCQPGEKGTVLRRSASASGEPVYVVAMDEEDSGLAFYFLVDEIEPVV
jgi:hypothetical protein